jgi:uncharacterized glyoxalase superfamily protein PhnB
MQSIYPTLIYRDCPAAIDFLVSAFGFERHAVYEGENGAVAHGELRLGDEIVMVSSASEGDERFNQVVGNYSLYIAVDDPDAHHDRAKAAGAAIDRPLEDQDYGSRDYTARDPEGNLWSFGTYRPELGAARGAEAGSGSAA